MLTQIGEHVQLATLQISGKGDYLRGVRSPYLGKLVRTKQEVRWSSHFREVMCLKATQAVNKHTTETRETVEKYALDFLPES